MLKCPQNHCYTPCMVFVFLPPRPINHFLFHIHKLFFFLKPRVCQAQLFHHRVPAIFYHISLPGSTPLGTLSKPSTDFPTCQLKPDFTRTPQGPFPGHFIIVFRFVAHTHIFVSLLYLQLAQLPSRCRFFFNLANISRSVLFHQDFNPSRSCIISWPP